MSNPLESWRDKYYWHPTLYVREVLATDPDVWQAKVMDAVASTVRRISVRSGHGVGKTTVAAWLLSWFLLTRYPCKAVVTSPTSQQLFDALFNDLKFWIGRLPADIQALLEVKSARIELKSNPEGAFISARTSRADNPDALQGVHAENVLLLVDEASGVPEQVFEAASSSMTAKEASTLLMGNPVRASGFFYETHHRLRDRWWTLHVPSKGNPRVDPAYERELIDLYGEDSNAYRVRWLGEFPLSDEESVIPLHLVESAMERQGVTVADSVGEIWGLDVARFGGASSALAKRKGRMLTEPIKRWSGIDLMQLCGRVEIEYQDAKVKPDEILVDLQGMGGGVLDRLRELGLPVRGINVSERAAMRDVYSMLRDELWFKCRDWLDKRDCWLPQDQKLAAELTSVRYKPLSTGQLKVESKRDMKMRGVRSPDLADALILTFAGRAATASGVRRRGNKALSRRTTVA